ncbi:hypothetical protein HERIO_878 [Hepatospora eriocheir]|uniref:Uncharacterized protein n=1 Tax=Hepatospora eriocheir TaxID=1081669 RepID=A0A1X0QBT0_9MICR|nr:hypothetical protein HERIO_878 [Hepatospora eriocheir]
MSGDIYCKGPTILRTRRKKYYDGFLFRCRPCNKEWSLFKNTSFSYKKKGKSRVVIPVQKIVKLIFCYLKDQPHCKMKLNSGITEDKTIVNLTNYVREVTH